MREPPAAHHDQAHAGERRLSASQQQPTGGFLHRRNSTRSVTIDIYRTNVAKFFVCMILFLFSLMLLLWGANNCQ